MRKYVSLKHMTFVPKTTAITSRAIYLPHHGEFRESARSFALFLVSRRLAQVYHWTIY